MLGKNELRVLSGKFKGKVLKSPRSAGTHPMGSREKLALFNMLQPYLADAVVLDAYAGTGALGIEALSRGAKSVLFVEQSSQVTQTVRENLRALGLDDKCEIYHGSVHQFAQDLASGEKYNLILADPPYNHFDIEEVAELIRLLKPAGILALSSPAQIGEVELQGLELQTSRKYAAARIAIYCKL